MFVTSFETVSGKGRQFEEEIEQPPWDTILRVLQRLDGDAYDSLILNGAEDAYMAIAGDNAGEYIVGGRRVDGTPFMLTLGEWRGSQVPVMTGGQEGEFPDNEIVTLEVALAAARTYYESGRCDARFQWAEETRGRH
jgi:hypothetical protein